MRFSPCWLCCIAMLEPVWIVVVLAYQVTEKHPDSLRDESLSLRNLLCTHRFLERGVFAVTVNLHPLQNYTEIGGDQLLEINIHIIIIPILQVLKNSCGDSLTALLRAEDDKLKKCAIYIRGGQGSGVASDA